MSYETVRRIAGGRITVQVTRHGCVRVNGAQPEPTVEHAKEYAPEIEL